MEVFWWIGFNILLLVVTFLLVPMERFKQLFVYGLIGGSGLAIPIFFIANYFELWETVGGIDLWMDVPLLPTTAWFFPVVIFGHFFPKSDSFLAKLGYIAFYALGAIVVQYTVARMGLWINKNWNLFYTFLLALTTHSILTLYIMYTEQYLPE